MINTKYMITKNSFPSRAWEPATKSHVLEENARPTLPRLRAEYQIYVVLTRVLCIALRGNNRSLSFLYMLEKSNCEVHTFDCSGPVQRLLSQKMTVFTSIISVLEHHGLQVHSPRANLHEEKDPCSMWTMTDIQTHFSHEKIDRLKIDIEGGSGPS
mmetsp:Transcript_17632/g.35223  ORF Transcript_17632/g.35223 Transcript_17632/m.35223 type:complete len:156 (+) Transcript_17632:419-886(+)